MNDTHPNRRQFAMSLVAATAVAPLIVSAVKPGVTETMALQEIDGDPYRYLTVAESLRENAWRHLKRAWGHQDAGRFDWAAGSMRKSHRNFQRAAMLDGDYIPYFTRMPIPRA